MPYKPLREILSELDAQQRRELTALGGRVDAAELHRARDAKRQLATLSTLFIERSWEVIAPQLGTFSLEAECGKSTEELQAYLRTLRSQKPAFAWGWTRARMDAWLMRWIEACVPNLLLDYPREAAAYRDCLRRMHHYWFRETPLQHLKAGYHTALGVACKWYGSSCELLQDTPHSFPNGLCRFGDELRLFASFSLTMLTRTDRYLWDSAGAEPLDLIMENGSIQIAHRAVEELCVETAPDYGVRLGCPALRARREAGRPAFTGIIAWVEQVFTSYLLEPPANPVSRAHGPVL